MPTYKVTGRMVRISSGTLELSKEQASVRMHNLNHLSGNKYEVLRPVEFKSGEQIGYLGELPKILADDLTAKAEADAAEKKAKALADAEAKKLAEAAAKAKEEFEAKVKKEWDANEALRKQWDDDFAAYLASVTE